ncbi:MAG: DinB family protein [Phycisphaerales bacterium]
MDTELYRSAVVGQMGAALAMLRACVQECPDELWEAPVGKRPYWEVAYHIAFYADLYLTPNIDQYAGQPAWAWPHAAGLGAMMKRPFTELTPDQVGPVLERARILEYLDATADKLRRVLAEETDETLAGGSGFPWYPVTRMSMHMVNLRHIQHHAGQLSAVLRRHGIAVDWVGVVP